MVAVGIKRTETKGDLLSAQEAVALTTALWKSHSSMDNSVQMLVGQNNLILREKNTLCAICSSERSLSALVLGVLNLNEILPILRTGGFG